jgi:hypothetical protein
MRLLGYFLCTLVLLICCWLIILLWFFKKEEVLPPSTCPEKIGRISMKNYQFLHCSMLTFN